MSLDGAEGRSRAMTEEQIKKRADELKEVHAKDVVFCKEHTVSGVSDMDPVERCLKRLLWDYEFLKEQENLFRTTGEGGRPEVWCKYITRIASLESILGIKR